MWQSVVVAWLLAGDTVDGPPRVDLTKPKVADPKEEIFRLDPNRDGLIYRGKRFTAYIAADGTVRFDNKGNWENKRDLASRIAYPHPQGTRTVQGTLEKWLGKKRPAAPATEVQPPPAYAGYIPPNYASPRELCQDPRSNCFLDQRKMYFQFNQKSDWDFHLLGISRGDPNREEKARLLAATAPMRDLMATQAKAQWQKEVLPELPTLLSALWSENRPAPERRASLHQLWKEFAEMPGNESACAVILGFIRKNLPAGSPDAFTPNELEKLRAGKPPFDPYAP